MPSLRESEDLAVTLEQAVSEKRYQDILPLIEANPTLINTVLSAKKSPLLIHLVFMLGDESDAETKRLLLTLLRNPELNWEVQAEKVRHTIHSRIIEAAENSKDYDLIKGLKDVPRFIFHGEKLTYELVNERLVEAKKTHAEMVEDGDSAEDIEYILETVKTLEEILSLIRDITILFAIETDSRQIMELLEKAGADPIDFLGEFGGNKLPAWLVTSPDCNVGRWLKEIRTRALSAFSDCHARLFASAKTFGDFKRQEQQIHSEGVLREIQIRTEGAEGRKERMEQAAQTTSKPKSP